MTTLLKPSTLIPKGLQVQQMNNLFSLSPLAAVMTWTTSRLLVVAVMKDAITSQQESIQKQEQKLRCSIHANKHGQSILCGRQMPCKLLAPLHPDALPVTVWI